MFALIPVGGNPTVKQFYCASRFSFTAAKKEVSLVFWLFATLSPGTVDHVLCDEPIGIGQCKLGK